MIPTLILVLDWKDPDVDFSAVNLPARAAELGSPMWTARLSKRRAVLILGRLGAEAEAAKPALESLHESKDPRLRYRAKNALRKIGE